MAEEYFSFKIDSLPDDEFLVVSFNGEEGLSDLYRFELTLISKNKSVDLEQALYGRASLTLNAFEGRRVIGGILASFTQGHEFGPYAFYKAELRPKLWWLTLTFHNQVFLNRKMPDFITEVLVDGGLDFGRDFEVKLMEDYPDREMVIQCNESHHHFLEWWLARHGACYWFMETAAGETVRLSDQAVAHAELPGGARLRYAQPTGLDHGQPETIHDFTVTCRPLPKEVVVKDYNYQKPGLDLTADSQVLAKGRGRVYIYGAGFDDLDQGRKLAKIRAEEYLCGQVSAEGLSNVRDLRPGYVFQLDGHYRRDYNQRYLAVRLRHEGSQTRYLINGLGIGGLGQDSLFYRNTFRAIPADRQFRPPRPESRPVISGFMPAKIDAAGSGQYAELDEQGRYKVVLPLDRSGRGGGKASAWLRLMQPYAGEGMGFHAPLHKGTEVLLAFIDGDPDRPVIAGAVPNPETPSPVNDAEQTKIKLDSASGNKIHLDDQKGREVIRITSEASGTLLSIGTIDPEHEAKIKALGVE
ncbi:MAG: type VI secretion system tip protein VgrG [Candidatus Adiutrix sp.]|jgi:type VI secretion system secreted protein VgrG|nr:type VI secretion system tip protein VgrG [Candidatus Adiutrix sp.]